MITAVSTPQYRVIAGPYRAAHRYAQHRGWNPQDYVIVVRAHQLAALDPARIAGIVTVKLHTLGSRIVSDINAEIDRLCSLWPVRPTAWNGDC